ncbi:hypothetical protein [Helicobacter sp. 23-1045]
MMDLLLISVDSPVLLGIYRGKRLVRDVCKAGKFSDVLPELFGEILRGESNAHFDIYYANGPGNFSAIKLTHIFLQSLVIALNATNTRKIRLFCTDAFAFSDSEFINAYGKMHFYKDYGGIVGENLGVNFGANLGVNQNENCGIQGVNQGLKQGKFCVNQGVNLGLNQGEIRTITLESKMPNSFSLPKVLDSSIFSTKCEPLYILPAV